MLPKHIRIWDIEVSDSLKVKKWYKSLFATIWGQCSQAMRANLQASKQYNAMEYSSDVISCLHEINGIIHNFDTRSYIHQK